MIGFVVPSLSGRALAAAAVLLRAVLLVAGPVAVAIFGVHEANRAAYDAEGLGSPFGESGDEILGAWVRWDSIWFLGIERDGYDYDPGGGDAAAFFPLYPLAMRVLGAGTGGEGALIAGLLVSIAAFAVALVLLHRLVALETDGRTAALTVLLIVAFPTSFFFTALYSEALFLALSVGAFWFARTGRWGAAGLCGLGAALTRSAGIALVVPLALMWWEGRRRRGRGRPVLGDAVWIALVPAGTALFALLLAADVGDPFAFVSAQQDWGRELSFAGPLGGLWEGLSAAADSAVDLLRGSDDLVLWSLTGPAVPLATQNLELMLFAGFAVVAAVGALQRLPLAYGAYAVAALAIALSYPRDVVPLFSISRFVIVIFPLFVWLALELRNRPALRAAWLVLSLAGLAYYSARFATWQWVA